MANVAVEYMSHGVSFPSVRYVWTAILRSACIHVQSDQNHKYSFEHSMTPRLRFNINHIILAQIRGYTRWSESTCLNVTFLETSHHCSIILWPLTWTLPFKKSSELEGSFKLSTHNIHFVWYKHVIPEILGPSLTRVVTDRTKKICRCGFI